MEKATSYQAIRIAFLVITTCLALLSLPGAKSSSLVQEQCSANSDCSETECNTSGQVICIDNKCTCLELLVAFAPAPELVQSSEVGKCWTSSDCERKLIECIDGKPLCLDGKCQCIDRKRVGKFCSVVGDCQGFYCVHGNLNCIDGRCVCVDDAPSPSPSS